VSRARRLATDDMVFIGVAVLLVSLSYTPLAGRLNDMLCAFSYRGVRWLLSELRVPYVADAANRLLAQGPFALEVNGLCSGLRGIAVLGAVIILVPLRTGQKLAHLALGTLALMVVNVVRIAHLFYLGVHDSPHFALFHEWIWPTAILGVLLLYRLVILRRQRSRSVEAIYG